MAITLYLYKLCMQVASALFYLIWPCRLLSYQVEPALLA